MAASGSFRTSNYDGRYLVFSWSEKSQNVANNTTTITWKLTGDGGGNVWYMAGNFKVVIAGETVYSSATRIQLADGTVVATGTHTFQHGADGTGSFTASAQAGIYSVAVNCTGSGTFALDAIPRASQPSLVTWPEHTQDVGEFGDEISIHMNRNSSAFTHTVRYQFGAKSGTIGTGVATGTTWTIPLEFMDLLPANTSGSGTIYVDTYNGTTKIGTKWCGFTAKVPASVKPTCSLQVLDATDIKDTYGNLVKGLSKLYVKTTGTAAYSSPIASRSVLANGVRYTAEEVTTGFLAASGTTTVTATVTDKRGRTSDQKSASFTVLNYDKPKVSAISVMRCNADGTANNRGEYVKVTFSAAITSLNSKNGATYTLRYKKTSASSWTSVTLSAHTGKFTVTNGTHIFAADGASAYNVEVVAKDSHYSGSKATTASTAYTLVHYNTKGNGVSFGEVSDKENTMAIALDVEFKGKVSGKIFDAIYPVGSIYISYNHTNPGTLFGGTWARISNAFLWAADASGTIGQTGGEKTVTLTEAQIPAHNHGGTYTNAGTATKTHAWLASGGSSMAYDTVNTGGGQAHNNMPPYIQVSIWRRTA
jgi:hypothetical protein